VPTQDNRKKPPQAKCTCANVEYLSAFLRRGRPKPPALTTFERSGGIAMVVDAPSRVDCAATRVQRSRFIIVVIVIVTVVILA
jgi:hypothetical protein